MAIVVEYVDPAKYEEICMGQVQKYGKPHIPSKWAVDFEAKFFLADYGFDRERLSWSYVFWWRGAYFVFGIDSDEVTRSSDSKPSGLIFSFISPILLPPQMMGHAEDVRIKVEEALVAYKSVPCGPVKLIFQNWEVLSERE